MKHPGDEATGSSRKGRHNRKPALQVICLGSGGGPSEQNATAFLVRSIGSAWAKGSLLAVDAGSHFAPIQRILERDFPAVSADRRLPPKPHTRTRWSNGGSGSALLQPALNRMSLSPSPSTTDDDDEPPQPEPTLLTTGPFAGLTLPHESARANALHVLRTFVSTYLITHPHLDHIAGFAINTAGFHATSRPKTLAALPSTVDAMKRHIFNDVIWPNLTDEDGGVGFVTFQRLKEGGDVMLGEGEGRGYIDVSDGLGVRAFKVSHGVCSKSPPSHQHRGSLNGTAGQEVMYGGGGSQDAAAAAMSGRHRSISGQPQFSAPGTPGFRNAGSGAQNYFAGAPAPVSVGAAAHEHACVVDSTAFFIRDGETAREVLMFGDVEPDSLSLSPRNHVVWAEAARKFAARLLGAVFIECSYSDAQPDAVLFGHLCPRHLIAELLTLAALVREAQFARAAAAAAAGGSASGSSSKRKRSAVNGWEGFAAAATAGTRPPFPIEGDLHKRRSVAAATTGMRAFTRPLESEPLSMTGGSPVVATTTTTTTTTAPEGAFGNYDLLQAPQHHHPDAPRSPRSPRSTTAAASHPTSNPVATAAPTSTPTLSTTADHGDLPLKGLMVVIIHVKDTLKDGPHVSETILAQLCEHEQRLREGGQGLGCEFVISESGESYVF